MRAGEVARSYSDFWGLDPVQLPYGYWFGLDTWLVLAGAGPAAPAEIAAGSTSVDR